MGNDTKYRKCPKCGLNYITGLQTVCTVCVSESRAYRGKYCSECGAKSGLYNLCRSCFKAKDLSPNDKRAARGNDRPGGYRTDNGMIGFRSDRVCRICGAPAYGRLCGRCYMATRDVDDADG